MTDEQKNIIADLMKRALECGARFDAAKEAVRAAQVEFSGVRIGDIVQSKRYGVCRVSFVDAKWIDVKPWVHGNPQKKDGTWGTAERHLYDAWEPV